MIVLETIETYFRILGIMHVRWPTFLDKLPIQKIYETFVRILYIFGIVTPLWFVIFEAETVKDYTETVAVLVGLSPLIICYWAFSLEKSNVFRIIDELRTIIKKSEHLNEIKYIFFS